MSCHTAASSLLPSGNEIALIGHPNVGKSALFQRLTGQRVTVSNYPGTTVEIARGLVRDLPGSILVDTPGVITFPPQSEDEQVTARVLFNEPLQAILQVGDAKNLRRTLWITVQLAEMGRPMALALNMMDEATACGVCTDHSRLSHLLHLPVIPTAAVKGLGVSELTAAIRSADPSALHIAYPPAIETALTRLEETIPPAPISARALGLLWLGGDAVSEGWLEQHLEPQVYARLLSLRDATGQIFSEPLSAVIQGIRQTFVENLVNSVLLEGGTSGNTFASVLGRLTTHPVWGVPVLLLVLYALYWFVGIFGAGTLVGLLEENLFGEYINPFVVGTVERLIPTRWLAEMLVGQYGLWTMGMTYALALILPIVTTFFLAFGMMEDSGYLPRLAALSNRLFKALGLNGKAVLPMVLGLGCVTMATLTTRVMETRRERALVTLLLALAVPCSAQLGVVVGMLAGVSLAAASLWAGVLLLVLMAVGWLAARVVPGERTQLLVELPPLRLPSFTNVTLKTLARLEWYVKEVVPLFLFGSLLLFGLDKSGLLALLIRAGEPLMSGWLGLPPEASAAFLVGFLRRDFGATGLFVMQSQGLLDPRQILVAMVTITLFIPCIASLMMMAKERGTRQAVAMTAVVMPLAFLVGGLLNRLLLWIGWGA